VLLAGCERRQHLVQQHLLEFGTIIEITMIVDDLPRAQALLAEIETRLRRQRSAWHAWEDSDLSRFNTELRQHSRAAIPPSLEELLLLCSRYYEATDGLFNPALGKLVAAYGFHGADANSALIAEIRRDIPDMRDLRIEGNLATRDVVILTQYRETKDRLVGKVLAGVTLDTIEDRIDGVAVETIHRHKGLEALAAIVILERLEKDRDRALAYIGLSRPRAQLVLIAPPSVGLALGLSPG